MANYVKFKQGLKKDFNTTNQPLTNGMIYFVIDENNNGSIYYDTIVDGKQATKNGTVHRVKFSGLPIKITGSVTGTGVISKDGETIEINTSTNHSHGLAHQDFTVTLSNDDTNLKWTRLGNQNGEGFWLKSIKGDVKAPAWFQPNYGAGIAFGGGSTKGIISVKYNEPSIKFAGGNGDAPVWYFTITGANDKTYDLSKIGGHSSDSAKLDHNITFKISKVANATTGEAGVTTNLTEKAITFTIPSDLSGFNNIQSTRFQGTADNADMVDYFHVAEEKYKYETIKKQPTSGADWCIKISTPDWNSTSETIYLIAEGNNAHGTVILKTGSRQRNWWGYATNYNGTGVVGVYKIVTNSDDVYIKVNGDYTSVTIRTTFNPTISIPTAIPDYKFTSVPYQGGFFSNAIYTDTLTFTTPKYWANVPISDTSKTDTQPTFNTAYVSNWWRSTGSTGWWNETYSGGITMEDKTYVKIAGNKSFLIPNGSLKIGGDGNIFFATGGNNATLKIYGQNNTKFGTETIAIQTCFDNKDPQTSGYTTQYAERCNLLLQPKGGQVYIGKNLTTPGDVGYKLLVGGNQWIEGNLVFKGAKEIKFIGSKQTYSMIRFIDNTSDTYGNGISIGGGGSTVIGAGESAMSYVTNGGDERLFLLSDDAINIEAGGDTISNRKGLQVTSDGHILPIKAENSNPNAQDLGSAADYWRNLYINNITLQGQVGNRLVWTNGNKILQAGYHYADTDRIAINTAGRQGYNFYVNGSSYFSSNTYIHRNYFLNNPSTGAGELVLTALGYKSAGYPVYNDPEFAKGANGISVYNNSNNGVVTHAIVSDASSGNSSGKILKITHTGSGSPGFGGFVQYISSRANAIFIQIFRAKIPIGRNVATSSNSMGDNYKDEWLTPTTGTGRWEWYARRVICGASGTFSTGGHVYIKDGAAPTASSPLVWYLSYCNVIDITKGNYDGLRTRYSDFVIYDSGEDGKDNKTPINDKYVAKIVVKTSNGTTFTLRGLNGAGNELADAVLTIPNAGSDKAGLITNTAQGIYGEKTLHENLRFSNISTGTRGIVGSIADNGCWRVVGRADATNQGYLEIATGDGTNEPIYMRQYSGIFGTITRTFTVLDGSGRSRAPELFEAKKIHINSKLNQNNAIADIGYQFQVTGTSNFTDNVDISGVTTHHNSIQMDANYSFSKPGKSSPWYGSHTNAMIRMTSVNDWSPLLAQKATNGYWILGHYNYYNEKDKNNDFRDQWLFGYLSDSNLEGTTGASNSLTTTYRLLNIGGNDNQRMFVSAKYNATVGSGTQPVYVQSNGNVATCSYSLSATIEAGTANRMAYYKTANQIGSSGHYVTSSQVGINAFSSKNYTFYVGGDSLFDNAVTINGNVHILPDTDVGLNGAGSLVIGNKASPNLGIDVNEIMARNNSKASVLYLNNEGGVVQVGQDGITVQAKASSTNLQSGGLRISSENAGNSGNVALELYRGNNSSWQIANEGAILYFRTNWVGEKKTTYAKNTLIIDNTTGSASIPYLAIGQEERNTTYGLYVVSSQSWIKNTLWTGHVYPDANDKWNLGSAQYQWHSFHVFRDLNIYGNGSTTDESHIKFNASDKTQRAIITFNGNTDNGAHSDTHLKIATSYGAIKIKPANGYLDLGSGNDLHIQVNTKSYNQDIIAAYDDPNASGIDLVIGSGATTIVGAGESAAAMYSAGIKNTENLYLSADGNVFLYTNCDTIANRRYACFDADRNFYPDADNSGSIGTFGNRWNTGWFNTLNLAGATSSTIANSTPRIIFQEKNGANKIQAVGIVYTDTDAYRPTKGLKIMDVDGSDGENVWLEVQGDIWTGGNIRINNHKSLIQNQGDTSNYTEAVKWYKGGKSQNTYDPQIGQHNTGNDGTGSICILPYATATAPWEGSVGLFIAKSRMLLDNYRVPTTGNSGGTVGSATIPVYSDGGVLKTITSYSGNAATATTASKLSRNAGSATKPIYFSGGVPVQCNDTLGVNISGNAASATYTTQLLGVQNNGSNTPYNATEDNLIRAVWNVKGDSRWYLKAGTYNCRVNYADNAGNADTVDGYHAADLFSGGYKTTLDLSALNNDLYYPVTGASIPTNGYHKIKISVHLSSGTKPSWATHKSGFTTNVELYTTASGWGTTHGETIILNDSYNFTNCGQVVGFTQNGNTSTPVLWLRGGGKYFVECDYQASWTIRTSLYYTQGSSSDTYHQSVEPQSSYPGFKAGDGGAINGVIRAGQVYGAVWNDYAEYRKTKEYIQPGYCVIETGKGDLIKSSERLQPGANIVSDTFGFAIGETEQTKTPLAVSGRVLAYPYEDRDSYQAGDPVCSGPNGTISKMTREEVREYPDRIIGTVSEIPDYEVWGTGNVKVNNRIWIKVK